MQSACSAILSERERGSREGGRERERERATPVSRWSERERESQTFESPCLSFPKNKTHALANLMFPRGQVRESPDMVSRRPAAAKSRAAHLNLMDVCRGNVHRCKPYRLSVNLCVREQTTSELRFSQLDLTMLSAFSAIFACASWLTLASDMSQ